MQSPRTYARASLSLVLQLGTTVFRLAWAVEAWWVMLFVRSSCDWSCPRGPGVVYHALPCHNISCTLSCVCWRRLPERNSTGILVGPDSACRQYRTSSATLSVDLWSGGTTNSSGINRVGLFAVAGPRAWNSLPPALRSTSKSFYFSKKRTQIVSFWTLILVVTTWIMTMLSALVVVCTIQ